VFDVSIFELDCVDFIIPLILYLWRVRELEKAPSNDKAKDLCGVVLTDLYFNSNGEDNVFDPYNCTIMSVVDQEEGQEDEFHFQRSGHNSIIVKFCATEGGNAASPWEVSVADPKEKCPLPTCLIESQNDILFGILDTLENDPYVLSIFSAPVDIQCFVDYPLMIEVPMDLSKIKNRLRNLYYTNNQSVKADMKLLRDNCMKYNTIASDVSIQADNLFKAFVDLFKEKIARSVHYDSYQRLK
jgi:hypothetical protein